MSRTHHHTTETKKYNLENFGVLTGMSSTFKRTEKRVRKAKEKQAIKDQNYENVPIFKTNDRWVYW